MLQFDHVVVVDVVTTFLRLHNVVEEFLSVVARVDDNITKVRLFSFKCVAVAYGLYHFFNLRYFLIDSLLQKNPPKTC